MLQAWDILERVVSNVDFVLTLSVVCSYFAKPGRMAAASPFHICMLTLLWICNYSSAVQIARIEYEMKGSQSHRRRLETRGLGKGGKFRRCLPALAQPRQGGQGEVVPTVLD